MSKVRVTGTTSVTVGDYRQVTYTGVGDPYDHCLDDVRITWGRDKPHTQPEPATASFSFMMPVRGPGDRNWSPGGPAAELGQSVIIAHEMTYTYPAERGTYTAITPERRAAQPLGEMYSPLLTGGRPRVAAWYNDHAPTVTYPKGGGAPIYSPPTRVDMMNELNVAITPTPGTIIADKVTLTITMRLRSLRAGATRMPVAAAAIIGGGIGETKVTELGSIYTDRHSGYDRDVSVTAKGVPTGMPVIGVTTGSDCAATWANPTYFRDEYTVGTLTTWADAARLQDSLVRNSGRELTYLDMCAVTVIGNIGIETATPERTETKKVILFSGTVSDSTLTTRNGNNILRVTAADDLVKLNRHHARYMDGAMKMREFPLAIGFYMGGYSTRADGPAFTNGQDWQFKLPSAEPTLGEAWRIFANHQRSLFFAHYDPAGNHDGYMLVDIRRYWKSRTVTIRANTILQDTIQGDSSYSGKYTGVTVPYGNGGAYWFHRPDLETKLGANRYQLDAGAIDSQDAREIASAWYPLVDAEYSGVSQLTVPREALGNIAPNDLADMLELQTREGLGVNLEGVPYVFARDQKHRLIGGEYRSRTGGWDLTINLTPDRKMYDAW